MICVTFTRTFCFSYISQGHRLTPSSGVLLATAHQLQHYMKIETHKTVTPQSRPRCDSTSRVLFSQDTSWVIILKDILGKGVAGQILTAAWSHEKSGQEGKPIDTLVHMLTFCLTRPSNDMYTTAFKFKYSRPVKAGHSCACRSFWNPWG